MSGTMSAAEYVATVGKKRKNKYRAEPQEEDGYKFASKAELRRYRELKLMQEQGIITGLEPHPLYRIEVNGVKITRYIPDFRYIENGLVVVEDVKGAISRDWPMRKKLMKAVHGIDVKEIRA